jgi:hypothetical protein
MYHDIQSSCGATIPKSSTTHPTAESAFNVAAHFITVEMVREKVYM